MYLLQIHVVGLFIPSLIRIEHLYSALEGTTQSLFCRVNSLNEAWVLINLKVSLVMNDSNAV